MNERIRELAIESKLGSAEFGNGVQYYVATQETFEKFAELIVRECASLFPLTFTDEQYQRRIDKTIKKHFGVEE
jgi:hypothetical protein